MRKTLFKTILVLPAAVLMALGSTTANAQSNSTDKGSGGKVVMAAADIVGTAAKAGKFETLIAAAKAADLVGTLQSPGPLTVFAPSDDAFKKLPDGILEDLLKPENKNKLRDIVAYHVLGGKVSAADTKHILKAQTLQGGSLTIRHVEGSVMIDNAKVVAADIACSNGVIHIIDSVLQPGTEVKQMGSMKKDGSMKKNGSGSK